MSSLRLVRDDEDRLSVSPEFAPSSSRVVPFVAITVLAQESLRRRTAKFRALEERNPRGAIFVEAIIDGLLRDGTQG